MPRVRPEVYVIIDNITEQVVIRTRNAEHLSRWIRVNLKEEIEGHTIRRKLIHSEPKIKKYSFHAITRNNKTFWKYSIMVLKKD